MRSALGLCLVAVLGCGDSHPCKTELFAQLYDSTRACLEPPANVGCTEATGCDDSVTWAIDEQSRCFFFVNLCLPAGFTALDSGDPRCPPYSEMMPICAAR